MTSDECYDLVTQRTGEVTVPLISHPYYALASKEKRGEDRRRGRELSEKQRYRFYLNWYLKIGKGESEAGCVD